MADTAIEWADAVWNPTTGCDKVSPGCGLPRREGDQPHGQCYALRLAKRLKAMGQYKYQTDGDPRTSGPGFGLTVHPDALAIPLAWRKPRKVFVNSMSDLFHARVPRQFVARVWAVMAATPRHTYQVLTKRPQRMARIIRDNPHNLLELLDNEVTARILDAAPWPLPNVWLGTSVEDQTRANERIPALKATPAAVHWLSCEPLLGPVDLGPWLRPRPIPGQCVDIDGFGWHNVAEHQSCPHCATIDWVVVGGESGPGARPMHPDWARSLREQCTAAGVAFFFKQWGEWQPAGLGIGMAQRHAHPERLVGPPVDDRGFRQVMRRLGKKTAGRELDGRTWDQYPTDPDPTLSPRADTSRRGVHRTCRATRDVAV